MPGFTKLFSSILESTIWCADSDTRVVWITLLASADQHGIVRATIPGLAKRAAVKVDKTRKAIDRFLAPDDDSSDPEFEGRRIEAIQGGWRLLNYVKYREKRDEDERREYMRNYMRNYRGGVNKFVNSVNSGLTDVNRSEPPLNTVNSSKPRLAQAEADTDTEAEVSKSVGTTSSEEISNFHSTPNNKKRASAFVLPSWVPNEAWQGFVEMRLKMRKPMTNNGKRIIVRELRKLVDEHGEDPTAVLEQSTARNYTGVFPVGGKSNGEQRLEPRRTAINRHALEVAAQIDAVRAANRDRGDD